ncbi:hypothetical protein [Streptomyces sp. NPDC126503]|uniref:hypothetical protein n=1 Tax=Streptomyces sp. NPDC126503 TaxID=3155315 RepID=UPI003330F2CA
MKTFLLRRLLDPLTSLLARVAATTARPLHRLREAPGRLHSPAPPATSTLANQPRLRADLARESGYTPSRPAP